MLFFFCAGKLLYTNITVEKLTKINLVKWWRAKQWTMNYIQNRSKERKTEVQKCASYHFSLQKSIRVFVFCNKFPLTQLFQSISEYFRVLPWFKRTTKIFVGQYRWRCTKRRTCYLSFFKHIHTRQGLFQVFKHIQDRVYSKFKEKNIVSGNATTVRRNKREKNKFMDNFCVNVCTQKGLNQCWSIQQKKYGWKVDL